MTNPYKSLPKKSFWKTAIANQNVLALSELWLPKYEISTKDKVITAGSCFAQHLSKELVLNGFQWIDSEPAPQYLPKEKKGLYSYGVFSFRTGNIYTAALLRQWVSWALGISDPSTEVWKTSGRYYDPFRPVIEPNGFLDEHEVIELRKHTLAAIREALKHATLFVFTLGLTEGWSNQDSGEIYPICPGTAAGKFCAKTHKFRNFSYEDTIADLKMTFELIRAFNPSIRFLLTVSPVPLTATASSEHVLVATTYSKSILRAVAGTLSEKENIDYFPSYEIISSFPYRAMFFEPNMRSVSPLGVKHVMEHFFEGLERMGQKPRTTHHHVDQDSDNSAEDLTIHEENEDVYCEDELLESFADEV